ncbi:MAG TPA: DUF4349 domain-containing protein [Acidimicrobiales bacterium]
MAVIDDDILGTLLREAGDSFTLPPSGAADIRQRVVRGDDESAAAARQIAFDLGDTGSPNRLSLRRTMRSHRLLAAAASLVILAGVAAIGVAVGTGSPGTKPSSSTSAIRHLPLSSPGQEKGTATTPSTTAPSFSVTPQAGAGTSGGTASTGTSGGAALNAPPTASAAPAPTAPNLPDDAVGQSARIEQTGSLDLKVPKGALTNTMTKLTNLAAFYSGFVSNSQTQTGATSATGSPSGSVTLEVPVANFPAVLKTAKSMGSTTQLSTKATDVTGQYVDLQQRITALQASRQQYLTIMAKATSIGDVLAVQAQLDSLQSQIEQLQGQLQVLTSETAYSTLTVAVSEATAGHHHRGPAAPSGLDKAWHDSVHGFVNGVEWLVRGAGPTLFVLLILGVLLVGGRLLWRRVQRHNL